MNLSMKGILADAYKSGSQKAKMLQKLGALKIFIAQIVLHRNWIG